MLNPKTLSKFARENYLRILLAAFFLGLAAYGFYGIYDRLFFATKKQMIMLDRWEIKRQSLNVIGDSSAPNYKKAEALQQLAVYDDDVAFKFAREWIALDDQDLVRASIKVLKSSRDKKDEDMLFQLYSGLDKDKKFMPYREDLLNSLVGKPLSQESLYKMVAFPWTKKSEKIKIYGGLLKKEGEGEQRTKLLTHLKAVAKSAKGDDRVEVILALSAAVPEDPDLLEMHRQVIEKKQSDLLEYSVIHLAKLNDPWLRKNYLGLLRSEDPNAQAAGIKALSYFCPPQGLTEIDRIYFLNYDLPMRALIVGAAVQYNNPESKDFLKRALADDKLSPSDRQILSNKISQTSNSGNKFCH